MTKSSIACTVPTRTEADRIVSDLHSASFPSEDVFLLYEEGNFSVSVHAASAAEISRARDIFNKAGARKVCTGELSTSAQDDPAEYIKQPTFADYRESAPMGVKAQTVEAPLREVKL